MRDASPAGGIPAPCCPVAQGEESYQGKSPLPHGAAELPRKTKKKRFQERIGALPEVRDLHRYVAECMSGAEDLPSQQPAPHENTEAGEPR